MMRQQQTEHREFHHRVVECLGTFHQKQRDTQGLIKQLLSQQRNTLNRELEEGSSRLRQEITQLRLVAAEQADTLHRLEATPPEGTPGAAELLHGLKDQVQAQSRTLADLTQMLRRLLVLLSVDHHPLHQPTEDDRRAVRAQNRYAVGWHG